MYKSSRDAGRIAQKPKYDGRSPSVGSGGQGEKYDLPDDPGIFFGDTRHIRRDAKEFTKFLREGAIPEDRVIAVMRRVPKLMERSADLGKVREFAALMKMWVHVVRLGYRAKETGLSLNECLSSNEFIAHQEAKATRADVLAVVKKLEEIGKVKASDYPELSEAA